METKEEMGTKEVGTKEVLAKVKVVKAGEKGKRRTKQKRKRRKPPQVLVSTERARSSIASSVEVPTICQRTVRRLAPSSAKHIQKQQATSKSLVTSGRRQTPYE